MLYVGKKELGEYYLVVVRVGEERLRLWRAFGATQQTKGQFPRACGGRDSGLIFEAAPGHKAQASQLLRLRAGGQERPEDLEHLAGSSAEAARRKRFETCGRCGTRRGRARRRPRWRGGAARR